MNEQTKQTAIIVFGVGALLVTLMLLLAKDCASTDEKKIECVKTGNTPQNCECLFSSNVSCR